MRKWHVIPIGSEAGLVIEASTYTVTDDNIGGFFGADGRLKHSVPTDKVMVIEITDDPEATDK